MKKRLISLAVSAMLVLSIGGITQAADSRFDSIVEKAEKSENGALVFSLEKIKVSDVKTILESMS